MINKSFILLLLCLLAVPRIEIKGAVVEVAKDDWPTEMYDYDRSGVTEAKIKLPLKLMWSHKSTHKPKPSWPAPALHAACSEVAMRCWDRGSGEVPVGHLHGEQFALGQVGKLEVENTVRQTLDRWGQNDDQVLHALHRAPLFFGL